MKFVFSVKWTDLYRESFPIMDMMRPLLLVTEEWEPFCGAGDYNARAVRLNTQMCQFERDLTEARMHVYDFAKKPDSAKLIFAVEGSPEYTDSVALAMAVPGVVREAVLARSTLKMLCKKAAEIVYEQEKLQKEFMAKKWAKYV